MLSTRLRTSAFAVVAALPFLLIPSAGQVSATADPRDGARGTSSHRVTHDARKRSVPPKVTRPRVSAKTVAPVPFVARYTAHAGSVLDGAGRRWLPMPANWGTQHRSTALADTNIAGTTDDVLFEANGWGAKGADFVVPARATYRVRMLFAEDHFTRPGQRVFHVRAEGKTVVSGLDIVGRAGRASAVVVSFDVPVRDGVLNLDYVKRVDLPLVSAIEVVSTKPVGTPEPARQAVTFAPGNPFTTRVDGAPLAANSATLSRGLAAQVRNHWGGTAAVNAYGFNVGFNVATTTTRKIRVGFHDCQHKGRVPAGLYGGPSYFVDVPVPPGAQPAAGSDGHMSVYDAAADKIWDFWQMRRSSTGGWEACWGGRLDKVSQQIRPVFPAPYGASASGLVIAGGMITLDDMRRNEIDHTMDLGILDVARWDTFSWPANRSDGTQPAGTALMEGQRVRLDPKLDLDSLDLTPFGRIVAEAAQKYGFIVTDRSGAVGVPTESGAVVKAATGVDPWERYLGGPAYAALSNFPWDHMQVLPADYGRPRA